MIVAAAPAAVAQRLDSARVAPRLKTVDTVASVIRPPLSPRQAFVSSLLLPGYAQTRLNRPLAGGIFAFTESIGIAMLRESLADLREAKRFRTDSLLFIGNDPLSGSPILQRQSYTDELINIRKGHVEDWVAFLVANHLFAGADAYVAAHLWDLKSVIDIGQTSAGTVIAARLRW